MLLSSRKSAHHTFLIRLLSSLLLALSAMLAPGAAHVYAQAGAPAGDGATYLVQFMPQASEAERAAWLAQQGAELVSWLPQIGVAEVRLPASGGNSLVAAGAAPGPVLTVEADAYVSGDHIITDPGFNNPNQGYALQLLRAAAAWDVTEGDNDIIVAIVDTGINPNHPEFNGRITAGYDFVNNDAAPTDDNGHGTHIAGVVAAGLNGIGSVGVCPQCTLMPVKVLNSRNGGTWSLVTKGILYAVDHGARVINLSLGASVSSATMECAIKYAADHGVLVVAAAGNGGSEGTFYPAAIPYVIAVSGTERTDVRWPQSNYGSYVDVAAPASSIYSSYYDLATSSGYAYMSGTSMATPFVSGLAGLVFSLRPELAGKDVTQLITGNAVDLGAPGKDKEFGHGRIDVYATLLAANGGVVPTPKGGGGSLTSLYLPSIVAAN